MLHYYDVADYSLDAFNTPTLGYGGEDDRQLQASVNLHERLTKESFHFQQDGPYRWTTSLNSRFYALAHPFNLSALYCNPKRLSTIDLVEIRRYDPTKQEI